MEERVKNRLKLKNEWDIIPYRFSIAGHFWTNSLILGHCFMWVVAYFRQKHAQMNICGKKKK